MKIAVALILSLLFVSLPLSFAKDNTEDTALWEDETFDFVEYDDPPQEPEEPPSEPPVEPPVRPPRPPSVPCLNDCSGQGRCVNGVCRCRSGYTGEDCSTSIRYLTSRQKLSNRVVGFSQWHYYRTDIPKHGYTLIIEVDEDPYSPSSDCDLYVNLGVPPTTDRYMYRDESKTKNMKIIASGANAGSWFIGVYGYQECTYSITAIVSKTACPDGCSGNGVCNNRGVCECNSGWVGKRCEDKIQELEIGKTISGEISQGRFEHFRVTLDQDFSALQLVLREMTIGDDVDLDLYVKYDDIPTTSNWDYANATISTPTHLRVPNAKKGSWYIGVYAYGCGGSSCRFEISATVDDSCTNQCSKHGQCVRSVCHCQSGYEGDYCETKTTKISRGTRYRGYVEDFTWNYYKFETNSMNAVTISMVEDTIKNGDCDLYIKRGNQKPTFLSFDYHDITGDSKAEITINNPGTSNWWIGVHGYRTCDFILLYDYVKGNKCLNGGRRPSPDVPCTCPEGYAGYLCEFEVAPSHIGEIIESSTERGQWNYYRIDLETFPSDLIIYIKEVDSSSVGNLWLFASIDDVPTIADHDFEDIDADTNYHFIRITSANIPNPNKPTYIVIGVHTAPTALRPSVPFKLTTWATPFEG